MERWVLPFPVVFLDEIANLSSRIFQIDQRSLSQTLFRKCSVIAFDLTVWLWVIDRCSHVSNLGLSEKRGELLRQKLWTIIGNDPRFSVRKLFKRSLDCDFNIQRFDALPYCVINDISRPTVDNWDQKEKRALKFYIFDVDVPMLVRVLRLFKSVSARRTLRSIPDSERRLPVKRTVLN